MNINVERFLALTALLAAPLVAAPACVINSSDDTDGNNDDGTGGNPTSTPMTTTEPTSTEPTTTTPMTSVDDSGTDTGSGGTESGSGETMDPDTGTTGADLGNCCVPDGSLGCEVTEVSECVCAEDPFCCDEGWDEACAGEVNSLGCGVCELPPAVWDCYCTATCDGADYLDPFQACGADEAEAAVGGQAACDAALGADCAEFTCDACECFTAEVAEIKC